MKKALSLLALLGLLSTGAAQAPADTYVVSAFGEAVTLDPARAYDTASGSLLENVYETLYTYDGASIDEFVPALATDYQVSEDGTTYTFTLREGVPFHSGNTMTCRDVEYSLERGMVVAHPEGAVSYLVGNQFLGTQTDGSDAAAYQEEVNWGMIDGAVECPDGDDGLTVQLNLTQPDPAFLSILAYTAFSVTDSQWAIDNGMWDGTEATWTDWIGRDLTQEFMHNAASGTGAYQLVEWTGNSFVGQAFADYWDGAPPIANVVYNYVEEQSTNILALQQGDADRAILGDRAALVQLRGAPGVTVYEDPEWNPTSVSAVFFNTDIVTENNEDIGSGQLDGQGIPSDFFADPNVRIGFAHLFDQQAFIEQIYEGEGQALTAALPPSFFGYTDNVPIRTLDLEAAEQAFGQAFDGQLFDTGFEFTALYNAGNTTRQAALEIIKENLEFLSPNFTMNIRSLAWPDFLARSDQGLTPMFVLGWGADYADPRNFFNTFYLSDGFYPDGRTNFSDEQMDQVLREANTSTDQSQREELYAQATQLHYDLAPVVPLPVPGAFIAASEVLQGVYYNPMLSHNYFWKDVSKN